MNTARTRAQQAEITPTRLEMLRLLERQIALNLVMGAIAKLARGGGVREHLGNFLLLLDQENESICELIPLVQATLDHEEATAQLHIMPPPQPKKAPIPTALRWQIWERDNFTCHYCGKRSDLAVDHVVPEIKGGTLAPDNLVTACRTCNSRKYTTEYETFIDRLMQEAPGL